MTTVRMMLLAGGLGAGLVVAATTVAHAGGANMDKISRGSWLVPTMPGQAHGAKVAGPSSRRPRRPAPTLELELRLVPAGTDATTGARPATVQATAGQPLQLQLQITNHGPAGDVRLRAFTSAFSVSMPAVVPVDANATTVVTLTAENKGCRGAGFIEIRAAQGQPGDGVASSPSVRLPLRCR